MVHAALAGIDTVSGLTPYADRREAGHKLADALRAYRGRDAIVLALPRGGVPVAYEVANRLGLPLDIALVRKIGAPGYPELGVGAVVDGAHAQVILNDDVMSMVQPSPLYLQAQIKREQMELERRRSLYRGKRAAPNIGGKTVIVVDDGIATGGTMRAVLRGLRRCGPARLVLAVPLAPRQTLDRLVPETDEIVCLASPEPFVSVGAHYRDFAQTDDEEVISLLEAARHAPTDAPSMSAVPR